MCWDTLEMKVAHTCDMFANDKGLCRENKRRADSVSVSVLNSFYIEKKMQVLYFEQWDSLRSISSFTLLPRNESSGSVDHGLKQVLWADTLYFSVIWQGVCVGGGGASLYDFNIVKVHNKKDSVRHFENFPFLTSCVSSSQKLVACTVSCEEGMSADLFSKV